jgi:hypothetical protein
MLPEHAIWFLSLSALIIGELINSIIKIKNEEKNEET